jgi:hypothetical protein
VGGPRARTFFILALPRALAFYPPWWLWWGRLGGVLLGRPGHGRQEEKPFHVC